MVVSVRFVQVETCRVESVKFVVCSYKFVVCSSKCAVPRHGNTVTPLASHMWEYGVWKV